MSVETDADRLTLLDDFGVSIGLASGSPQTEIIGIFDNEYYEMGIGDTAYSTTQPKVTVRTSDISNVGQGDIVIVEGTTYTVSDIQPDGTGISILRLHKND